MLEDRQDAFGHLMHDYFTGRDGREIIERDDGLVDVSVGPTFYFLEYDQWRESEKEAIAFVRGRVLDVGCGAGRHALYLQGQGFDVTGLDNSPLALEVCRARGLKKTHLLSITQISKRLGIFDTIMLLGNNFALTGTVKRTGWLLRRFYKMTPPSGRIIAQNRNPYITNVPEHLDYHARNRSRGRLPGQSRIRVRYKKYATPWIDFLMLSPDEMKEILTGTGWRIERLIAGNETVYIAVIIKE